MPTYQLKCPKCGKEYEEIICKVENRNTLPCDCGEKMKVKITTANFRVSRYTPRVQQWVKEKGL